MQFDYVILGGTIVDGTGKRAPYKADVGVSHDKIVAIGKLDAPQAHYTIDAKDQVVSPGFIDVHIHGEIALLGGRDQMGSVRQGVTTQLTAPDGFGWAPLPPKKARELWHYTQFAYGDTDLSLDWNTVEAYLGEFVGRIPANLYPQVPHCAVRLEAMGWDARPATDEELSQMLKTTREWLDAGAGCLCLGLDYQPSANSDLRELVTLSKLAKEYGAIYAAHIRYRTVGRKKAWEETLEIARQSGIPVHISHERVDQESAELLDRVDREGIDLSFESYLYTAGMTHLTMMLPLEYQIGSMEHRLEVLRRPETREKSLPYLRDSIGPDGDQIVGYTGSGRFVGMTLAQAAESEGKSWDQFAYDLMIDEDGIETFVFPWQTPREDHEACLDETAVHPRMMIASDGVYNIPHPHPRGYGCFVQFLGRYVRNRKLLSLEEAIYKMSGYPAERFGIGDRGRIAEGLAADLVVFNPETVSDCSTWDNPVEPPIGVHWVLVNGIPVVKEGTLTAQLPGRVLRHLS